MKTTMIRKEDVVHEWFEVDATGKSMGRISTVIARHLMGKHKPYYTPHVDCGDFIIVTNIDKLAYSGTKLETKIYHYYSGFPGGKYRLTLGERMKKHPERVFRNCVRRMLPKNRLGRQMLRKLKVYAGAEHRHIAQQPKPLEI